MSPENQEAEYLKNLLRHVSDAVVATDVHGRVTYSNPAAQRLYGIAEADAVGRALTELVATFDVSEVTDIDEIARIVAQDGAWRGELTQRTLDGRELLVEATVAMLRDSAETVVGSVSILREISGRKAAEERIAYQATHDGLTGLLNRTAFLSELDARLTTAGTPSLVFLDLNGFKAVNDLYGHDHGDEVLHLIGRRLAGAVRAADVLGRIGGDEFVLLVNDLSDKVATEVYLDRIMALFNDPVRCKETMHTIGVSAGVAHSRVGDDVDSLFRRADNAMYDVKRSREVASAYKIV